MGQSSIMRWWEQTNWKNSFHTQPSPHTSLFLLGEALTSQWVDYRNELRHRIVCIYAHWLITSLDCRVATVESRVFTRWLVWPAVAKEKTRAQAFPIQKSVTYFAYIHIEDKEWSNVTSQGLTFHYKSTTINNNHHVVYTFADWSSKKKCI